MRRFVTVDLENIEDCQVAAAQAAEHFGGLDIGVNALCVTLIRDTPIYERHANTSYDLVGASRLVQRLEEVGISYFEQPLPVRALRDTAALRRLAGRVGCAIMADESMYGPADALALATGDAFDVLANKFIKSGGFRRSREIGAIADAVGRGMNCAGTANGSYLEAIAGAHLCASVPNHVFGAEFVMGLAEVDEDPLVRNRPVVLRNGHATLPMLPGLGAELDEHVLDRLCMSRELFR